MRRKSCLRRYGALAVPLKEASNNDGRTIQRSKGNVCPLAWYSEGAVPPTATHAQARKAVVLTPSVMPITSLSWSRL